VQNVENPETADTAEEGVKVQVEEQSDTTENKENVTTEGNVAEIAETGEEATLSGNKDSGNDSLWNQNTESNQVFVTGQSTTQTGQVNDLSQMQFNSYFSVETAQIMEQIAEQIRIVVTPDTTSMEMQLNPENLGKMYLHISSEEGVVNAQFIATNEVVKEALESQIATLRENLTQAGVKVDAIEVTIASHEFERNLEQNQKNPEEQMVQEEKQQRRRNLTADSLDELSGVMTEEETLVAQIMRDNGNTIDFTA
jgi:flagellar hook-length control protein FliK